jgi:PAS domain S-box-containing protein
MLPSVKPQQSLFENLLIKAFITIFAIAAFFVLNGTIIEAQELLEQKGTSAGLFGIGIDNHHVVQFASSAVMVLTGFGLVGILLVKLDHLRRIYDAKKEADESIQIRAAAMDAASDGISIIDADQKIVYLNKALLSFYNLPENAAPQWVGRKWNDLCDNHDWTDLKVENNNSFDQDGKWRVETRIQRADGSVRHADLSMTQLENGGFVITARDITSHRKAEEDKESIQKQFFQAQKMEAIGRLAGGMAHDFNNILASLMGYTEFLLEDLDETSKDHHFARQIMHGIVRARQLVDQILAFSRRRESARETINLVESVHECTAMLHATLPASITLDTQIDTSHATINGNATQISQTLMNLCVNAKDAMEGHGDHGTLKIGVAKVMPDQLNRPAILCDEIPAAGDLPPANFMLENGWNILTNGRIARNVPYVCLSVEDTGSGMPRDVMEHIFEPFFTTKDIDRGTGLGLSSVHGIISGHQGAIIVKSYEGKGTRFEIYLPLTDEAAAAASGEKTAKTEKSGQGHILIVEDQDHVREMVTEMLHRFGYRTHAVASGEAAIDHLRERPDYDLVISDHTMPGMTGVELAKEVALDLPQLPFIIFSGYSKTKLETAMDENPSIRAVLRKPVDGRTLSQTIKDILGKRKEAA